MPQVPLYLIMVPHPLLLPHLRLANVNNSAAALKSNTTSMSLDPLILPLMVVELQSNYLFCIICFLLLCPQVYFQAVAFTVRKYV